MPNTLPNSPALKILIVIIFIVIAGGLAVLPQIQRSTTQISPTPTQTTSQQSFQPISNNTLVYGTWAVGKTRIKSFDLSNGTAKLLAELPVNVKKISVLSPDEILYIDNLDSRDHGSQLTSYNIRTGQIKVRYQTENGFGIDDYVISTDKKYVATWEVIFAPGQSVLYGGKSRVVTMSLVDTSKKHNIYDGTQGGTKAVHYPRAILNNGDVYCDEFLPNSGAGWAHGMSFTKFDGSGQEELTQMADGTYGTQPQLSPDGRYLAFAGYDGSKGSGTELVNGYRKALVMPNTVELLDTATKERRKLNQFPNDTIYARVDFDFATGKLIVGDASRNVTNGLYSYDFTNGEKKLIDLSAVTPISAVITGTANTGNLPTNILSFVSYTENGKVLLGQYDTSSSSLGNLGYNYSPPVTSLLTFDPTTKANVSIPFADNYMQVITMTSSNYFTSGTILVSLMDKNTNQRKVQLEAFYLKPDLSNQRGEQQSSPVGSLETTCEPTVAPTGSDTPSPTKAPTPKCKDLYRETCKAMGYDVDRTSQWSTCYYKLKSMGKFQGECYDSPLYLYGEEGKRVQVKVNTTVYNAKPAFSHSINAVLGKNGSFSIDNQTYKSISYDYVPAFVPKNRPVKGSLLAKSDLVSELQKYAKAVGLNEQETTDLIEYGKTNITSPYVFLSFFDQKTSEQILPLSFEPKPDNYLNVVFYFKQYDYHPTFAVQPPVFPEPIKRDGFTAIEVSEMLE